MNRYGYAKDRTEMEMRRTDMEKSGKEYSRNGIDRISMQRKG